MRSLYRVGQKQFDLLSVALRYAEAVGAEKVECLTLGPYSDWQPVAWFRKGEWLFYELTAPMGPWPCA